MSSQNGKSIWKQLALGGTSVVPAVVVTHPLDIVKCRQQLAGYRAATGVQYGLLTGMARIVQKEGVTQLFAGISPAIVRAYTYSATRLGMYEPIRSGISKISGHDEPTFTTKVCAAFCSGTLGMLSCIYNFF